MIRSDVQRNDIKRPRVDYKKKQFANAAYKDQDYPFRLNFYEIPPTAEISLEDFEKWAIDRLRGECL
jgi:DNA primase large subunit